MPNIAIVGAGISALHLALRLQQTGVATTVYAERTADEIAAGRPLHLPVRFGRTQERERTLGVAHWDQPEHHTHGVRLVGPPGSGIGFLGRFDVPASGVDFRVYLPRLIADYQERGGRVEPLRPEVAEIERISQRHDLVVVAVGRQASALFPRDPARSPYEGPQRVLTAGLFRGIAPVRPGHIHFQVTEVGEIFSTRILTADGPVHGMVVEALPGGPLEQLASLDALRDAPGFVRTLLKLVEDHAPELRERIDAAEFGIAKPGDVIQGGITPVVRRSWAALSSGRVALAIGDAWITNDPLAGQGANLGSRTAFELAELIAAGGPFDEAFARRAADRLWSVAEPAVHWSNLNVGPPVEQLGALFGAATSDQRVADAFATNFNAPEAMWEGVRTPENTDAWLSRITSAAGA
ncbi:styrene monooxygenase/indole monooxygenase family protein [Streptomyces sp. NBRC 109706]|uniref:styrene monooxygenase/indole monooxygenase family protein n=1 Tax=Streptomyces sp. NBRC 109706 TaxID=1550035 RepID=UPI00078151C3|nr:styrene monooxygenase/indole monooxygenase family protein [Streptomyces sp. NBRC 109706]